MTCFGHQTLRGFAAPRFDSGGSIDEQGPEKTLQHPFTENRGRGDIVDRQSRMRGRGSQRAYPWWRIGDSGPAINDHAMYTRAHLEGEAPGMRGSGKRPPRSTSNIEQDHRAPPA